MDFPPLPPSLGPQSKNFAGKQKGLKPPHPRQSKERDRSSCRELIKNPVISSSSVVVELSSPEFRAIRAVKLSIRQNSASAGISPLPRPDQWLQGPLEILRILARRVTRSHRQRTRIAETKLNRQVFLNHHLPPCRPAAVSVVRLVIPNPPLTTADPMTNSSIQVPGGRAWLMTIELSITSTKNSISQSTLDKHELHDGSQSQKFGSPFVL